MTGIKRKSQIPIDCNPALWERESSFRELVEQTGGCFWEIDENGFFTYLSPNIRSFMGYELEELIGKQIFDLVEFGDAGRVLEVYKEAMIFQGPINLLEVRMIHKEGYPVIFESAGVPVFDQKGEFTGCRGVARNITARKRIEEALRRSEERFRLAASSTSDLVYQWDLSDNSLQWFGDIDKLMGYEKGQFPRNIQGWKTHIHPEEREMVFSMARNGLSQKKRWAGNYRVIRKDGGIIYLLGTGIGVYNGKDKPVTVIGAVTDITQRKKDEDRLTRLCEENELLLDNIEVQVWYLKDIETYGAVNDAHAKFFGVPKCNLSNKALGEVVSKEEAQICIEGNKEVFLEKKQIKSEEWVLNGRGIPRLLAITKTPKLNDEGSVEYVVCSAVDITDQRRAEEEIKRADKLELIGVLAGGIAHDFNNYLATLLGNICLAMSYQNDYDKVQKKLENMKKATLQAKELSQQLFVFAKGAKPVKKVTSVKDLLVESTKFTLSESSVTCQLLIADDLYGAEVDEGQITQAIYNIIINAVQAAAQDSFIKIKAVNYRVGDTEGTPALKEGDYIKIFIEDNGPGIPPQDLKKIFDPFFTTRTDGSGLGLAAAYTIIKNHDGCIEVNSVQGRGATFCIYLPAVSEYDMEKSETEKIIYGSGKILVLDDDEEVREAIGEMLRYLNYRVDYAEDGTQVLDKYVKAKNTNEPYDLVVMDLTIPGGMGGKQTIKKLIDLDPQVKAVVSSGYSNNTVISDYKDYGFKGAIKKPYSICELSTVIYRAMEGLT